MGILDVDVGTFVLLVVVVSAELHFSQPDVESELLFGEEFRLRGLPWIVVHGVWKFPGFVREEKSGFDFEVLLFLILEWTVLAGDEGEVSGEGGTLLNRSVDFGTAGVDLLEAGEGVEGVDDLVELLLFVELTVRVLLHDFLEEGPRAVQHVDFVDLNLFEQPYLLVLVLQADLFVLEEVVDLYGLRLRLMGQLVLDLLQLVVQLLELVLGGGFRGGFLLDG
jgi:hypothetical protein